MWILVAAFEMLIGASFNPIHNHFIRNQWGITWLAEQIQPVRDLRKASLGQTLAVESQNSGNNTPMLEEVPEFALESLGLEDAYFLDFNKLKVVRKRVGTP